jgi:hypothetical protein
MKKQVSKPPGFARRLVSTSARRLRRLVSQDVRAKADMLKC